jgi:hypothetical protein
MGLGGSLVEAERPVARSSQRPGGGSGLLSKLVGLPPPPPKKGLRAREAEGLEGGGLQGASQPTRWPPLLCRSVRHNPHPERCIIPRNTLKHCFLEVLGVLGMLWMHADNFWQGKRGGLGQRCQQGPPPKAYVTCNRGQGPHPGAY